MMLTVVTLLFTWIVTGCSVMFLHDEYIILQAVALLISR